MSGPYYGDYPTSHTAVCMTFDSFAASTGASSAASNFAAGDIVIFKDGGTTQRSSSAGITVSTSFDSNTGLQMVIIDLSDNTDSGFYTAGHEYSVAVADITIDSQTIRFWLGSFSIERAGGALALLKSGTFGLSVLDSELDTIAGYIDTEVAAIKTQTDKLTFTIANQIDANVLTFPTSFRPGIRKNVALLAFEILMTDSTNHNPVTGLTVSVTRSIDGATFGTGTIANIAEIGNGWYSFDFGAGDLNGTVIGVRAIATGADDLGFTIKTSP